MKKKKTADKSKKATLVLNKETLKNLVGKVRTGVRAGFLVASRSDSGCCGPATCCGT
jgi:hypothetical protein